MNLSSYRSPEVSEGRKIFRSRILILTLTSFALLSGSGSARAQSGTGGARPGGREYGVNLTFAVYQYDAQRSPELQAMTRLSGSYSSAQEEIAYLKDKNQLQDLAVRHIRSV